MFSIESPDLAIIVACYGQPQMMRKQMETWHLWSEEVRNKVEFLVIDDHGTPPFGIEFDPNFDLAIMRSGKDIQWNQMGARNLGQKQARAPWRLMLDPDMCISHPNVKKVLERIQGKSPGIHFKPWLKHQKHDLKDFGSPNLYVAHKADFWRAGGYNEDFAGHKGYSDVVLHRSLAAFSKRVAWPDVFVDFFNPGQIPDAQTLGLNRDLAHNLKLFRAAVNFAGKNNWKLYAQGITKHVRFPWEWVRNPRANA